MRKYQNMAGVLFVIGLVAWIVLRSGDPLSATLWRDALWVFAAAVGGYGVGHEHGAASASDGDTD